LRFSTQDYIFDARIFLVLAVASFHVAAALLLLAVLRGS
jgi:hypothetical protein